MTMPAARSAMRTDDSRTSLDHQEDDRLAGGEHGLGEPKLRIGQLQVVDVAGRLGIGHLAEAEDDDVGRRGRGCGGLHVDGLVVGRARHVGQSAAEASLQRAADRGPVGRIERRAIAEPGDRPAVVQRGCESAVGPVSRTRASRSRAATPQPHSSRARSTRARRAARPDATRREPTVIVVAGALSRAVEQADARFQRQDAPDGVVDPRHRDGAFVHELHQQVAEAVVARDHAHVDARQDGSARGVLLVGGRVMHLDQLLDVFPSRSTMTPSKPSSPRSTSFSSRLLTCPGMPLTSPELTITDSAPALTAAANGGRSVSRIVMSGISAGVRSWPLVGTL